MSALRLAHQDLQMFGGGWGGAWRRKGMRGRGGIEGAGLSTLVCV